MLGIFSVFGKLSTIVETTTAEATEAASPMFTLILIILAVFLWKNTLFWIFYTTISLPTLLISQFIIIALNVFFEDRTNDSIELESAPHVSAAMTRNPRMKHGTMISMFQK